MPSYLKNKKVRLVLLMSFNLICFYFLYSWLENNISLTELKKAVDVIPPYSVVLALCLGLITLLFYGKRLAYMINQKTSNSFWIVCYGFGANSILPFRMGDVLKVVFAKQRFSVPATKLALVKVFEKLFDLSFLVLIGATAFGLGVWELMGGKVVVIAVSVVVLFLTSFLLLWAIKKDLSFILWLKKYQIIRYILDSFNEVLTNQNLKLALLSSAVIWLITILMMYSFYSSILIDFEFSIYDALALVFLSTLSLGVPSAPGGIGMFEAAVVFYLTKFVHVPGELALVTAISLHMIIAIPHIILMFLAIWITKKKHT